MILISHRGNTNGRNPEKENTIEYIEQALKKGLILFWLLYEKRAVRITPPLTISNSEIKKGCKIILNILDSI